MVSAKEAKQKLIDGNHLFLEAKSGIGDISQSIRKETAINGQHPYAVVITCSDSRVIPEAIFMTGLGDLFVIRVAGNVISDHVLGSIEYAVEHLGTNLVVVLGHTGCGAVNAALHGHGGRFIDSILDDINEAIGTETDAFKASCLNVCHSTEVIRKNLLVSGANERDMLEIIGAMYNIEDGKVVLID